MHLLLADTLETLLSDVITLEVNNLALVSESSTSLRDVVRTSRVWEELFQFVVRECQQYQLPRRHVQTYIHHRTSNNDTELMRCFAEPRPEVTDRWG